MHFISNLCKAMLSKLSGVQVCPFPLHGLRCHFVKRKLFKTCPLVLHRYNLLHDLVPSSEN